MKCGSGQYITRKGDVVQLSENCQKGTGHTGRINRNLQLVVGRKREGRVILWMSALKHRALWLPVTMTFYSDWLLLFPLFNSHFTKCPTKCLQHLTPSLCSVESVILKLKNNEQLTCVHLFFFIIVAQEQYFSVESHRGVINKQLLSWKINIWLLISMGVSFLSLIPGMPNAQNFSFGLKKV